MGREPTGREPTCLTIPHPFGTHTECWSIQLCAGPRGPQAEAHPPEPTVPLPTLLGPAKPVQFFQDRSVPHDCCLSVPGAEFLTAAGPDPSWRESCTEATSQTTAGATTSHLQGTLVSQVSENYQNHHRATAS